MTDGTTTWNYTYNADGMRTSRTNGQKTYTYTYDGDKLTYMTVNGYLHLYFAYDASGTPISVIYNGVMFYYVTNVQGDVIGILDSAGAQVATYAYDAWGNPLAGTESQTSEIGTLNPLRYRSYIWDSETCLYYLQSRYYNPEMGRFINADEYPSTGQGLMSNNMFAYCGNSPILNADYNGKWTVTIGYGYTATAFIGVSESKSITFDRYGVSQQYSYSSPKEREATSIGLLSVSQPYFLQVTNKEHASELENVATYLGGSVGNIGFDVVGDKPVAKPDGKLIGVQVSTGISGGVDVHVAQTYTVTTKRTSWREIWKQISDVFSVRW